MKKGIASFVCACSLSPLPSPFFYFGALLHLYFLFLALSSSRRLLLAKACGSVSKAFYAIVQGDICYVTGGDELDKNKKRGTY